MVDVGGEDAVATVDKSNSTILIQAVYLVNPDQYSAKDIDNMNSKVNSFLNDKNYSVSTGKYEGFSVKFNLSFTSNISESGEILQSSSFKSGDVPIGNYFGDWLSPDKKYDFVRVNGEMKRGEIKGKTGDHRNIKMSSAGSSFIDKIHEIFHTLFVDKDNSEKGIGRYYGGPQDPDQDDINDMINNENLPKVNK